MSDGLAIGVDLGATKIATALVTSGGRMLDARENPTEAKSGPDGVVERITRDVLDLMRSAPSRVRGIGIGSPGIVDSRSGTVRNAVNLGWTEVCLSNAISRRVDGLPVFVENDANVAAIGEGRFGSARGSQNYVLLTVGSGLGAGVISGGKLVSGSHGMAADLGHWPLDIDGGRTCDCGRRGCAETIVSGPGLVTVTRGLLERGIHRSVLQAEGLTPAQIVTAARAADPAARAALRQLANWLGQIAALCTAVLDPDVIVIGGGLGVAAMDLIKEDVDREMRRRLTLYQIPPRAACIDFAE